MPELGSLGTVRGALGNERPYREQTLPMFTQGTLVPQSAVVMRVSNPHHAMSWAVA